MNFRINYTYRKYIRSDKMRFEIINSIFLFIIILYNVNYNEDASIRGK